MDIDKIQNLLTQVQQQEISVEDALGKLRDLPYDDLGFARLDEHRSLRQGLPEVVYCQHKTPQQVVQIMQRMWQHQDRVLGTRASEEMAAFVLDQLPEAQYDPASRLLTLTRGLIPSPKESAPFALIVTGGTSDQPIAEEAAQTLEFFGSRVERAYDVGVAGVHRLLDQRQLLFDADVVISVAGMEGALTSVVGGLVSCPVVGVPTSVGYGANFEGVSALLAMLNSCALGVAVVNIDNGFGAAVYAHLVLRKIKNN